MSAPHTQEILKFNKNDAYVIPGPMDRNYNLMSCYVYATQMLWFLVVFTLELVLKPPN